MYKGEAFTTHGSKSLQHLCQVESKITLSLEFKELNLLSLHEQNKSQQHFEWNQLWWNWSCKEYEPAGSDRAQPTPPCEIENLLFHLLIGTDFCTWVCCSHCVVNLNQTIGGRVAIANLLQNSCDVCFSWQNNTWRVAAIDVIEHSLSGKNSLECHSPPSRQEDLLGDHRWEKAYSSRC